MRQITGNLQRRSILAACGAAIGLAGCVGEPSDSPTQDKQGGDETPTPTATQYTSTATDEETTPANSETEEEATPSETDEEDTSSETEEADSTEESDDGWYVRPDGSPQTVPEALVCEEEHEGRFDQRFTESKLYWGDDENSPWQLRIDTLRATHGEIVTIRLRNVSEETQERSAEGDFNIQVKTEEGWQDVRVKEEPYDQATNDALYTEAPGEGVKWEVTMTEEALPESNKGRGRVCPSLSSGRYRFAFYGVQDGGGEAIAVGFDFKS